MTTHLIETASKLLATKSQQHIERAKPIDRPSDSRSNDGSSRIIVELTLKIELWSDRLNGSPTAAGMALRILLP